MSVSSCLEEMLLHTNEGVGPHTQNNCPLHQGTEEETRHRLRQPRELSVRGGV